jgi:hypothetical protein
MFFGQLRRKKFTKKINWTSVVHQIVFSQRTGVARFFSVQHTYQNGENIPNDHKMYQMAVE